MIAYRQLQAQGTLTDLQFLVYNALAESGPVTASELMEKARVAHPDWTISMISNFEKRLSELRRNGVARELSRRVCSVSGHLATVWEAISPTTIERDGQIMLFGNSGTLYMRGH